MRALVSQANESPSIHCRLDMTQTIQLLDETIALNIYRIAQEALTNANVDKQLAKTVVFSAREPWRAATNGGGVQRPAGSRRRRNARKVLVSISMDYRASVLGGTFEVESKPIRGTRISCIFPFEIRVCEKVIHPLRASQGRNSTLNGSSRNL